MYPITVMQFCTVVGLLCAVCAIGRRWAYITLSAVLLTYAVFLAIDASNHNHHPPTIHLTDQKAQRVV